VNTADRIMGYLRQKGGRRIHPLGSEGGLTGPQRRRVTHKMNRRKRRALVRAQMRREGDGE
jgi:hypothetical protein